MPPSYLGLLKLPLLRLAWLRRSLGEGGTPVSRDWEDSPQQSRLGSGLRGDAAAFGAVQRLLAVFPESRL